MSEMAKAYDVAARAVRERFREQRPALLAALERLRKGDVAVYRGVYDSVEEVLKRLGVPFTLDPKDGGAKAKLIFVNCGYADAGKSGWLRQRVEEGAWLVSSDWALSVVQGEFPGTLQRGTGSTGDEVVGVEPNRGSLWSDVVVLGADPQWWLEGASYPIRIAPGAAVRVEAASHELLRKYEAPVVAASFDWGAGGVYHVISHFWLKRTRNPGERYGGPCSEFLARGMRLSAEGIGRVLKDARARPEAITFASMQSAATSTELIAQLCARAGGL
jgi:hypothetical protein